MKTCFVNGCFDVLHVGHIRLFKYAKEQANYLIVAIDTDEKIKKSKGNSRPFNTESDRKEMLGSIKFIDEVLSFDSNQSLEILIEKIKPDVMIIGSDWEGKEIVGFQHAKELKYFRRIDGYSTTKILESAFDR
tara:strand:- start:1273 stop:1671 length:399 start_codon:yes stop_codon:yes gene_type:complete